MSDDWDAEDFVPPPPVKETVKSSWEDEEEEEVREEKEQEKPKPAAKPKVDKPKAKKEDSKAKSKEAVDEALSDPIAEKLRQQRLVEESDFKATKELFGSSNAQSKKLEEFFPKTEAEFLEYANLCADFFKLHSKSFHYPSMLKAFLRSATENVNAADAKDVNSALHVIANEKLKAEKDAEKGKKKVTKKKQLIVDRPEAEDVYSRGTHAGDDEYDFM